MLTHSANFKLKQLPESFRLLVQDLEVAFAEGNHKSAKLNEEFLANALEKDLNKGWIVILPDIKYKRIPGLILNPMGVVCRLGISPSGEFFEKKRITHDLWQSFISKY